MALSDQVIQNIVTKVLHGEDYRIEILTLINAVFLDYAISFFKKVVEAKLRSEKITADWYKAEFLDPSLPSDELIINSGLNKKTISNMYNSARREIVIDATMEHYESLFKSIEKLVENDSEIDITLTIKFKGVSVDLDIGESLVVINTLAVKRAELRGGAYSSAGKNTEKIIMQVLCMMYKVPTRFFGLTTLTSLDREVDFYLIDKSGKKYLCEVKLMGKGNPESADAVIARDTEVFVADKLSDLMKKNLTARKIKWIELRSDVGYKKFGSILEDLGIVYEDFTGSLDQELPRIFKILFH